MILGNILGEPLNDNLHSGSRQYAKLLCACKRADKAEPAANQPRLTLVLRGAGLADTLLVRLLILTSRPRLGLRPADGLRVRVRLRVRLRLLLRLRLSAPRDRPLRRGDGERECEGVRDRPREGERRCLFAREPRSEIGERDLDAIFGWLGSLGRENSDCQTMRV